MQVMTVYTRTPSVSPMPRSGYNQIAWNKVSALFKDRQVVTHEELQNLFTKDAGHDAYMIRYFCQCGWLVRWECKLYEIEKINRMLGSMK